MIHKESSMYSKLSKIAQSIKDSEWYSQYPNMREFCEVDYLCEIFEFHCEKLLSLALIDDLRISYDGLIEGIKLTLKSCPETVGWYITAEWYPYNLALIVTDSISLDLYRYHRQVPEAPVIINSLPTQIDVIKSNLEGVLLKAVLELRKEPTEPKEALLSVMAEYLTNKNRYEYKGSFMYNENWFRRMNKVAALILYFDTGVNKPDAIQKCVNAKVEYACITNLTWELHMYIDNRKYDVALFYKEDITFQIVLSRLEEPINEYSKIKNVVGRTSEHNLYAAILDVAGTKYETDDEAKKKTMLDYLRNGL